MRRAQQLLEQEHALQKRELAVQEQMAQLHYQSGYYRGLISSGRGTGAGNTNSNYRGRGRGAGTNYQPNLNPNSYSYRAQYGGSRVAPAATPSSPPRSADALGDANQASA